MASESLGRNVVGGRGALSHRSAAAMWQLRGFVAGPIHITTPRRIKSPVGATLSVHRSTIDPARDVCRIGNLPVTSPGRTLLDLCATEQPWKVEDALDSALQRQIVSLPRLRWELNTSGGRGKTGSGLLRRLLDEREAQPTSTSPLEKAFLGIVQDVGLPRPLGQFPVATPSGMRYLDFAYPHIMLAIELDGAATHLGRRALQNDLTRQNELIALGWRVLRFTWDDVTRRPSRVAERIRSFFIG